ncbi:bifunctional adenosylcobinamide kinase/adenosylcobinamide-phosphate guanylyltransferase [Paenibacillus fonticola]|uniref:bifunctional adenosylcobinamide kinase/adenosylcobinamide-phosphate guanylyltransferase n=1 Tax=Paenibacillus fonticola TaxID=379896 RepID=UPI00037AB291|nr:bifunctional adenosylcobinamide kinase/adenosylcobinamide-phosphate guanylyltransferase [Paenibacillus fonticola]
MIVMVTGGARSGKSSFAEQWCMKHAPEACYIATAQAFDAEMEQRIALHRQDRAVAGYGWETIEEPLQLGDLLLELGSSQPEEAHANVGGAASPAVLVDCLTLWLSNMLLAVGEKDNAESKIMTEIDQLLEAIKKYKGTLVIVTNEVGSGIVPAYALGRQYRDLAGILNRRVAAIADQVFLVTVGIPIELKSREYKL